MLTYLEYILSLRGHNAPSARDGSYTFGKHTLRELKVISLMHAQW